MGSRVAAKPKGIVDPFNGWVHAVATPSPQPIASKVTPNLLQIHVPSESTYLDMGAGATPGIRMTTDNHVHLTARSPLTSISFGKVGGEVEEPGGDGLNISTAGAKHEMVTGKVIEHYKNDKDEHVEQNLTEHYDGTKLEVVGKDAREEFHAKKTEVITGAVDQSYSDTHHWVVGKASTWEFNGSQTYTLAKGMDLTQTVGGNSVFHVKGTHKQTVEGDETLWNKAKTFKGQYGFMNEVFMGERFALNVLTKLEVNAALVHTTTAIRMNADLVQNSTSTLKKEQNGIKIAKAIGAELWQAAIAIGEANMHIYK